MAERGRVERLTKRAVDAAKPAASRFVVWDAELKGFGLRVEPSGHKTFIARYRAGGGRGGKLRQATLGRYGTVTVDEARTAAKRMLGAAAVGADPVEEKRSARQAGMTVAEVCDWYLKEARAGRVLGRRGRPIKASTLTSDELRINAHVRPLIGRKPVSSLSVADMEHFQAEVAAGRTAKERIEKRRGGTPTGGEAVAARSLGMLRTVLEHAKRKGLIAENPAKGARKLADRKRKDRLSLEQLTALGKAMREAEDENPTGLAAIRLMTLTGFRRNEALGIKPAWLLDAGGIEFPDTKSGAQVRPIGRAAMDVLKRLREGHGVGEWLFPADRGDGHFIGVRKVLNRVATKAKVKVTPHVLRHTFSSVAGDLGFSELTIAGLLGHAAKGVTAGYVHLDLALVAAADRVSSVIAAALDGKPAAEVISLSERRQA